MSGQTKGTADSSTRTSAACHVCHHGRSPGTGAGPISPVPRSIASTPSPKDRRFQPQSRCRTATKGSIYHAADTCRLMAQHDNLPAKTLLAPLFLVLGFTLAVAALPIVPADRISGLASGHLLRNLVVFAVVAIIALGVVSVSALLREQRRRELLEGLRAFGRGEAAWKRWASLAMPHLYLALLLATFSTYKQLVLPSAGFGFDPAFAELDRLLFLGIDPWRVTHMLVPTATATSFIDTAYMLWFLPMILIVLLSWMMPARLQTQYPLTFAMAWIVGGTG